MLQLGKLPSAAPLVAGRASLGTFKRMSRATEKSTGRQKITSGGILPLAPIAPVTLDNWLDPEGQLPPVYYGRHYPPVGSL